MLFNGKGELMTWGKHLFNFYSVEKNHFKTKYNPFIAFENAGSWFCIGTVGFIICLC